MEQYFALQEVAERKLQVINDSVDAAQQRFARRHKLTIGEDPEGKRLAAYMRQVSEVNAYQHKVFLAQFRIEKANAQLSDALRAQDAAGFEAARVKLLADAQAALTEPATVPAFRGKDAQYREAAKSLVAFYAGMCENQFVKLHELLLRKDQLSKADVTAFNGCINQLNSQLNSGGQKHTEAYNRAGNAFMAVYIPVMND